MPKVSDEHREWRRKQILDGARDCFIRKGFHQTSMTDVFEASGLSSGAVYGYFRSKDEIIAEIADEVLARVDLVFGQSLSDESPPSLDQMLLRVLGAVEELGFDDREFARLAPQVWVEASRNPALGEPVRSEYKRLRGQMADVIRRLQDQGSISWSASPDNVAAVVFGSLLGYVVQKLILGDVTPEAYADGLLGLVSLAH